jgi:hypothetical protein
MSNEVTENKAEGYPISYNLLSTHLTILNPSSFVYIPFTDPLV